MYGLSIILILIVYWYATSAAATTIGKILAGVWIGTDDFVDRADISGMMVYFGAPSVIWGASHKSYIIIFDDVYNGAFTMSYKYWYLFLSSTASLSVDLNFEDEQLWPRSCTMKIDIANNELSIYDANALYCKLYKSHTITNTL